METPTIPNDDALAENTPDNDETTARPRASGFRFSDMRIGIRIVLVLALPVLAALSFGAEVVLDARGVAVEARNLGKLAATAEQISATVHEMQKERGMSAGFINSKGKSFADELPAQRGATDKAIETMLSAVRAVDADTYGETIAKLTGDGVAALADLKSVRQRIDTSQSTVPAMAKFYGTGIARLLGVVEYMVHLSRIGAVTEKITAYTALLQAKERAGQERAMGTAGFGSGAFSPQVYQNFVGLIAAQRSLIAEFRKNANAGEIAFCEKTMSAPALAETERMRGVALKSVWGGDTGGISGQSWFDTITGKIDLMKKVEDHIAADLIALTSRLNTDATTDLWTKGGLAGGALALTLLFGIFIVRGITVPIGRVTNATKRLAEGDKDTEISIRETGDEVGTLVRAIKVFRENLIETDRLQTQRREAEERALEEERRREEEKREAERQETVKREKEAAERQEQADRIEKIISEFDNQVTMALDAVAAAASQMQGSAQAVSASAEQTNQKAGAVAAASEEASTNVQTVATATEELSSSIQEISRQVSHSNEISQSAIEQARQTNAKVEGLAEAAQKIGEVVNLINDIASQTNLLALNATIEAARAGEAGKGFAVVASEVKSLATQTAKATEEIASQIGAIQGATNDAVQAIQEISTTISQIGEIATTVASAVEEQGAATGEIATNVQQAAIGTQEVSNNITQVTQAAGESQAASVQMLEAANSLAQQGDSLRQNVDRFLKDVRSA
jgi:methyl-accepting chemotaxis protein